MVEIQGMAMLIFVVIALIIYIGSNDNNLTLT